MTEDTYFFAKKNKVKRRADRMQAHAQSKKYVCSKCGKKRGKVYKDKKQLFIYCPRCENPEEEIKAFQTNPDIKKSRPNGGILAKITTKLGLR